MRLLSYHEHNTSLIALWMSDIHASRLCGCGTIFTLITMYHKTFAIDAAGLYFTAKLLIAVFSLGITAQYGVALAQHYALQSVDENSETDTHTEQSPAVESPDVQQKMASFKETLATRTIGTASVDTLSQAHERLIAADLTGMMLYLFENGTATAMYPIVSKGKRGSRWETPTGLYEVEVKEIEHFSTIGEVHMPYSMQFFGNFFIHGWPYYPDGTPVPDGYSGGCIRLATEDAERVFAFAANDTPIFIWEDHTSESVLNIDESIRLPRVSAQAYLVADIRTGEIYAERSSQAPFPIASLTKLVTALVANETIHFNRTLTISDNDRKLTLGTPGSLPSDTSFEAGDLLYPLIMESNNAVAYTLAHYFGMQNFMQWMNDKARAIGMSQTIFDDPSGISPSNVSTARDLFVLMRYIHNSQSFLLNVSRQTEKSIHSIDGDAYDLRNLNVYKDSYDFIGGKTGYTPEAGQTMAAIFELPTQSGTSTVAFIVLRSADRKKDIDTLRAWFARASPKAL